MRRCGGGDATNFFAPQRYTECIKSREVLWVIVYADLVMVLNFLVDLFLLAGTNCLAGYSPRWKRCALAAAFGAVYAGVCVLPQFRFLGNFFWRLVSLGLLSVIAFGYNRSALRRGILFVLLSMALGGIALGMGRGGFAGLICGAAMLSILCIFGFRGKVGQAQYISVQIRRQRKAYTLTALRDTGNTLRDPVTGQSVLVVGADVAWDILGLTPSQLKNPIDTMQTAAISGLRLIPYRAVGQPGGMLLAVNMDAVWIDGQQAGKLVAFAPERLQMDGAYQALAGGLL